MMNKCRTSLASAIATLGLSLGAAPANAEDWKVVGQFGWFGVGKAYEIEKGHFYWVGEFSGTFFNDKGPGSVHHLAGLKCPGHNDLNFNTKKGSASGYCIITDPDGDQAYATWSSEGDTRMGKGTYEYTGGTGKYKGISGKYPFTGVTQVNWADGTASGYAIWNR